MIRFFDVVFSFFGLLFLLPVMLVLYVIDLFDTGPRCQGSCRLS